MEVGRKYQVNTKKTQINEMKKQEKEQIIISGNQQVVRYVRCQPTIYSINALRRWTPTLEINTNTKTAKGLRTTGQTDGHTDIL